MKNDPKETKKEAADLLFHMLVLLEDAGNLGFCLCNLVGGAFYFKYFFYPKALDTNNFNGDRVRIFMTYKKLRAFNILLKVS